MKSQYQVRKPGQDSCLEHCHKHDNVVRYEPDCVVEGHDVAGTIAAVGLEVTGFAEGDEVFALTSFSRDGGAAEYMTTLSTELSIKPPSLSFEQAAAIPLSALWVWQALFEHADAKTGQKLLVTGAGGMRP